ncbi:hypothetical protein [Sedimentisphaera salicampi]|uniref:Uncharacterized protein n=1 Tax=Sedimentisphaera salicampi TaxID=1941349 RepID=A0A1W6LMA2_9BACT|nr:hypothetical protein [Sedimentisphaera salicampi]ARN56918.1 hypothetical protein STSP1_01311 [Sedimentisphaera salicampi]
MSEKQKRPYYALDIRVKGIEFELKINDVSLFSDPEAEGLKVQSPVNDWLFEGLNIFDFILYEPKPLPKANAQQGEESQEPAKPEMLVKLSSIDFSGEYPQPDEVLMECRFPSEEIPKLSAMHTKEVKLEEAPESTLWSQAEDITGRELEAEQTARKMIKEFAGSLESRNFEAAFEMMRYKFKEYASANGFEFERIREVVLEQYAMIEEFDFHYEDVPDSATAHVIEGDGRILRVFRKDDKPAVVFSNPEEDSCFGIPIYIARIGGEWKFVR